MGEEIVIKAYKEQKVGARRLELIIEIEYDIHILHNRIHGILLKHNLAKENGKKKMPGKNIIA